MKGGLKQHKDARLEHRYDLDSYLTDRNDVLIEMVPFDHGYMHGFCHMHYFDGGMLFHMRIKARENCRPLLENSQALIKMHFCLRGQKKAGLENPDKSFHTYCQQNNIHYIPVSKGYFDLTAGEDAEFVDICLTEQFFQSVFDMYPLSFISLASAVTEKRFWALSERPLFTSAKMENVLFEILTGTKNYSLKKLYFHNKVTELLLLQFEQFRYQQLHHSDNANGKQLHDLKKLEQAKIVLTNQYQNPPSLKQLAKIVGLNEYRLKQGFKEVFDTTIYAYLRDFRLQKAREMILSRRFTISEVCYHLGYESTAHFSRLFKSKFEINPSDLKKAG